MKKEILSTLRLGAGYILATAFQEIFPKSRLLCVDSTDTGFFVDIEFSEKISEKDLVFLEDRINQIISANTEFATKEMVPTNAFSYLKYIGYKDRLLLDKIAQSSNTTVNLFQVNSLHFLVDKTLSFTGDQIRYFKLLKVSYGEGNRIQILGALFTEKDELKKYLVEYKKYLKKEHIKTLITQKMLFWGKGKNDYVLNEKGLELKSSIIIFFKNNIIKQGFSFVELGKDKIGSLQLLFQNKNSQTSWKKNTHFAELDISDIEEKSFFEGFYRSNKNLENDLMSWEYIICSKDTLKDSVISSLKFYLKILNILNVKHKLILNKNFDKRKDSFEKIYLTSLEELKLSYQENYENNGLCNGASIEFLLEDGQKWLHKGPMLYIKPFDKRFVVIRSTLRKVNIILALLIEKGRDFDWKNLCKQVE